jgi:hypothetical protein
MSQLSVGLSVSPGRRGAAAPGGGLCCPQCRGELSQTDSSLLGCEACDRHYRKMGGIWCLVSDPGLWSTLWRSRFEDYREFVQQHIASLGAQLQRTGLLARTEQRIRSLSAGLEAQLSALSAHFALLAEHAGERPESVLPAGPRSGPLPAIKCYENLFRDWSWGEAESNQSLELVTRLAPSALGRVAVFGAGAGRLAVDVHTTLKPALYVETWA